MSSTPLDEAEEYLRLLAATLTDPADGECLQCYVFRMLAFGCTGSRWTRRYRDLRAPNATALLRRLRSKGAGCDCGLFMNAFDLRSEFLVVPIAFDPDGTALRCDPEYPDPMPTCHGVRRGSTQPCTLWLARYRYRYGWW
ncbi:MAG: DUF2695 domain-containing protein [Brachybacterium tyrofermentans]|uniref:DUF2695 domain-containing protein n=1 Tax=Brachybacterium tyrofermentans TaxID=47848 RepID=A0ABW0FIP5_9MICO|nr:DUF2695 domain-containing protein [Brachybacterium tyrofermentans]SLN04604.1 hypothetical protein FM103_17865 [Corynebacterium xerosis]